MHPTSYYSTYRYTTYRPRSSKAHDGHLDLAVGHARTLAFRYKITTSQADRHGTHNVHVRVRSHDQKRAAESIPRARGDILYHPIIIIAPPPPPPPTIVVVVAVVVVVVVVPLLQHNTAVFMTARNK